MNTHNALMSAILHWIPDTNSAQHVVNTLQSSPQFRDTITCVQDIKDAATALDIALKSVGMTLPIR